MDAESQPEPPTVCPVCRSLSAWPLMSVEGRDYFACSTCEARFLDPRQLPSAAEEFSHYSLHENDPADPRYCHFLAKLADPLLAVLPRNAHGLDYGCGPGPALAAMLKAAGHRVALYDPFFYPGPAPLAEQYDFVTCTETAEHFHHPAAEFDTLAGLVRPGGWLAIMTCFQTEDARFADWHYRRDPTHVVFYREATMRHIARTRGWQCEIPVKDVALMRVPAPPAVTPQAAAP